MCKKLGHLIANKSPLLQKYLHIVNPNTYMPYKHDTNHLLTVVKWQHNTTPLVGEKVFISSRCNLRVKYRLASLRD